MRFTIQELGVKVEKVLRDVEWLRGAMLESADPHVRALADRLPVATIGDVESASERAAKAALAGLETWTWRAPDGTERTFYVK